MHRSFCVVLHGLYRGAAISCENHLSTAPSPGMSIAGAASEKALQAQGNTPCAPRGGLLWVLGRWPDLIKKPLGVPASWGSREAATFWSGLLLGCLGVASGLSDRSHLSTALWGIQKGKADVALGLDWRKPDEPPRPRGPTCPPTQ
jgi:hypothetical protein